VNVQAAHVLLGDLDLLQRRGDLLEREVAAFAAEAEEPAQLLRLGERLLSRILIQSLRDRL
jgi:hypothetical protein